VNKKAIIIGAGFGGLSAACLLAKQGYQVKVFEKNDQPGGRAMMWKHKGFSFDMGPSWYLMPEIFERFFAHFNRKPSDYYSLKRLDPNYRIFFDQDQTIDIHANLQKNLKLFDQLEPNGGQKFQTYLDKAKYQYDVSLDQFLYKNYRTIVDFFNRRLLLEGAKLNVFQPLDKYINNQFQSDQLRKILQYTIVFLGGDPKNTPAIYSLMAHVDFNLGVWYPTGGMNAVAQGMHQLAQELGVTFHFNSPVSKILVQQGRATGIQAGKKKHSADLILSNADYPHTETQLLDPPHQTYPESYWDKKTIAPSAFIIYLGINKKIKSLTHHNLYFDQDWQRHFRKIFDSPSWPKNPSFYVCAPSVTDKTVAPKGKENLFILVPIASGLKETTKQKQQFATMILDRLEQTIGEPIQKHILFKRIFTGSDFSSTYNAYQGTALGLSHTLLQTAIFRPKQKSPKVKGLYYSGQYTHPGIGVPMTLIASEIVSDMIKKDS